MHSFEARALRLATRLISKYGEQVSWTKPTTAPGSHSWSPIAGTPGLFTPKLVVLSLDRDNARVVQYLTNTEVAEGSEFALMSGECGFAPSLVDNYVNGAGVTVGISWIDIFRPAGTPLLYTMGIVT